MNKKGFTLIELITVIALLSIVMVVLVPKISEAIKTSRADQLEEIRETIVNATEVYLSSNCGKEASDVLLNYDTVRIYLSSINSCGLIDESIYNPVSGDYFNISEEYLDVSRDEVGVLNYNLSF